MYFSLLSPASHSPIVANAVTQLAGAVWTVSQPLALIYEIGGLMAVLGLSALWTFKRKRAAQMLRAPDDFRLLRAPGFSLDAEIERLGDRLVNVYLFGPLAILLIALLPLFVQQMFPHADVRFLMGSVAGLLSAGCIWCIRRMAAIIDERANLRLGCKGERLVAEELQSLLADGCHVVNDVPAEAENTGARFNLDHVVISPRGLAVVETKTRSKPADIKGVKVIYDGESITWPRYASDRQPLEQVRRNAQWLGQLVARECGITVPVGQVVAIPGWSMDERKLTNPRVVTGRGVADAVRWVLDNNAGRGAVELTATQIEKIKDMIEARCREG